jgi:hypothetical protein
MASLEKGGLQRVSTEAPLQDIKKDLQAKLAGLEGLNDEIEERQKRLAASHEIEPREQPVASSNETMELPLYASLAPPAARRAKGDAVIVYYDGDTLSFFCEFDTVISQWGGQIRRSVASMVQEQEDSASSDAGASGGTMRYRRTPQPMPAAYQILLNCLQDLRNACAAGAHQLLTKADCSAAISEMRESMRQVGVGISKLLDRGPEQKTGGLALAGDQDDKGHQEETESGAFWISAVQVDETTYEIHMKTGTE